MPQRDLHPLELRSTGDVRPARAGSASECISADGEGVCFRLTRRIDAAGSFSSPPLSSDHSHALAELLPLLLCGEESAAIVFDNLCDQEVIAEIFRRIHVDEARHVRISSELLRTLSSHDSIMDDAVEARVGLAALLKHPGAALDRLHTDTGKLFSKIRTVAPSLFA